MDREFEGEDLSGAMFRGCDLSGARFRDVNLTGVAISHAWVVDVDIDALVERVVINGVDVTDYVHEHDSWYPLRGMLRPAGPDGMRASWDAIEGAWAPAIARAERLSEAQRRQSVGGEWSFVQTVQHLVFAMDKWFNVPILGEAFAPIGLPNSGSRDFGWPGVDLDAAPELRSALDVHRRHAEQFRAFLERATPEELDREVEVLENGVVTVRDCVHTVFEEEFWHLRYATRDLAHFG